MAQVNTGQLPITPAGIKSASGPLTASTDLSAGTRSTDRPQLPNKPLAQTRPSSWYGHAHSAGSCSPDPYVAELFWHQCAKHSDIRSEQHLAGGSRSGQRPRSRSQRRQILDSEASTLSGCTVGRKSTWQPPKARMNPHGGGRDRVKMAGIGNDFPRLEGRPTTLRQPISCRPLACSTVSRRSFSNLIAIGAATAIASRWNASARMVLTGTFSATTAL